MNGNVIGVNTAIYTQSAGYQGIGFAMPSNTVVAVYNDLISPSHKVVRGSIGISFNNGLSSSVNRVYGFKNGVLVQLVQPGGPADKAGLKPGDIITSIDGRTVKDGDDLVNDIAGRRPGTTVHLGYLRDGKQDDATVTIGDRDKVFASMNNPAGGSQSGERGRGGRDQAWNRCSRYFAGGCRKRFTHPEWRLSRCGRARLPICSNLSRAR